ncbi:DUF4249 family protein [Robiginitalea sediminis]|uniref:DUF4249 family protein n=1 Tax=Robiginitalea sediminis TaxID=1982593 RepID=UPI000B4B2BB5|nr:DUF4249 family protein [Robiginitalea sediminis]
MKRCLPFFCFLFVALAGCEDVIEVETPGEAPRLVVEGLLRVDVTQEFIPVEIRLTQTAGFFGEIQPVTDVDNIVIILSELENGLPSGNTGTSSLTQLEPGSGVYVPDPSFDRDQRIRTSAVLENDIRFTMVIDWQGRRYAAQTEYVAAPPIDRLEQGDNTLFGDDETEVVVAFTDIPDQDNYYVFDFGFGNYLPSEDTFYKGQQLEFSYFYDQVFEPGEELRVSILGADLSFYNYMALLVEQSGDSGDPFQTPVATVRGNVFDVTGLDNIDLTDNTDRPQDFPLGYFAIVQEQVQTLTIE